MSLAETSSVGVPCAADAPPTPGPAGEHEGLPLYTWGTAPEHLRTRTQLDQEDLSAAGVAPVAYLAYRRRRAPAPLFDPAGCRKKERKERTPAQKAATEAAMLKRRTCTGCGTVFAEPLHRRFDCPVCADQEFEEQRRADLEHVRAWAVEVLADNDPDTGAVFLDWETTDLDGYGVEIAIIDVTGRALLDTRIHPHAPIHPKAHAVHGIAIADLADAPAYADIHEQLVEVLASGRRVVIYNKSFDIGIWRNELLRHLETLGPHAIRRREWKPNPAVERIIKRMRAEDAMYPYSVWAGDWSDYWGEYRWQRLNGGHSAVADCRATLDVIRTMARPDQR